MSPSLASWGLFAVSVFGLWLTGQNPRWGWWFALANQFLMWLPWAIWAGQPGLAAQSFVFAALYARNLHRWRNGTLSTEAVAADSGPHAREEPRPREELAA